MNVTELLADLSRRGMKLWVEEGKLRYRAPKGVLTPALLEALAEHKAEILSSLERTPAPHAASVALSHGQQALWFLHQLKPESPSFNICFAARVRSAVETAALKRALQALVDRHDILRTTFRNDAAGPIQDVRPHVEASFETLDASALSREELDGQVLATYQRPFDLQRGPIIRLHLFTISPEDHVLLLVSHHIAIDGWSMIVLLNELRALYAAERVGQPAQLPPARQYADYVRWQTAMLAGPEGERQQTYWVGRLAGDLRRINLPTRRSLSAADRFSGGSYSFHFPEEAIEGIKSLALAEKATMYMALLAAFQLLLYKYSGQDDVLVGSPSSGRTRGEFAGTLGLFSNRVLMRAALSEDLSFRAFLGQVRQTVFSALEHQDFPFALLTKLLRANHGPGKEALYQVTFNYLKPLRSRELLELVAGVENTRVEFGGLTLEPYALTQQEGQVELSLNVIESGGQFSGAFRYNAELFEGATISAMAAHLQNLLRSIAAHPEDTLAQLSLLSAAEEERMMVTWNTTAGAEQG